MSATLAGFCFAGLAAVATLRGQTNETDSVTQGESGPGFQDRRVNSLLGMKVENRDGQLLGWLKDFVVNLHSGQVSYALVASGGFLGLGMRVRMVPIQDLSLATTKSETLALDISQVRWRRMPTVKIKKLSVLASSVIGDSVLNRQGQKVGEIADLLVDVGGQKPTLAILSPLAGAKPAHRDVLTVPLRVLTPTTRDRVILNTEHSTLITKG